MNAKRISPQGPEILGAMGRICLKQDLYTDAIENLSAAVKLRPDNESYSYMLASALVGKQRYNDAIPLLTRSLNHHPEDNPVLNYSVGAVEFLNQDLVEAERHLRLSLRYRQDQVGANYYLALLEERKGNPDEALRILRTLAKNHPEHAPTFVALGTTLVQAGNYREAKQVLDRALQLDSASVKAHYQLGIVLGRLGDREASKKEFAIVDTLKADN
jgi:protein O-GlcNAc transferase